MSLRSNGGMSRHLLANGSQRSEFTRRVNSSTPFCPLAAYQLNLYPIFVPSAISSASVPRPLVVSFSLLLLVMFPSKLCLMYIHHRHLDFALDHSDACTTDCFVRTLRIRFGSSGVWSKQLELRYLLSQIQRLLHRRCSAAIRKYRFSRMPIATSLIYFATGISKLIYPMIRRYSEIRKYELKFVGNRVYIAEHISTHQRCNLFQRLFIVLKKKFHGVIRSVALIVCWFHFR